MCSLFCSVFHSFLIAKYMKSNSYHIPSCKLSKFLLIFSFTIASLLCNSAYSQNRIGNIVLDKREVFDSTDNSWFFAANLANKLHFLTSDFIIEDELLFNPDDIIDLDLIEETERNLRKLDLFTKVDIYLDSVGLDTYNARIVTQDKWTLQPSILLGTGGGESNYGVRLAERNFLGAAYDADIWALNRSENNIGWQVGAALRKKRIFRTELALEASLQASKYRTDQLLSINKSYRTLATENAYGFEIGNSFGSDFLYRAVLKDTAKLLDFHTRKATAWYSKAWGDKDKVYFTVLVNWEDVDRGKPEYKRAFDNTGKLLLQFSSVSAKYIQSTKLNSYLTEDFTIGGYGAAILGRTKNYALFGDDAGKSYYYLAALGEQSYYNGNLYLYAAVSAGSGFSNSNASYTYQDFKGLAFYKFEENLMLAARFTQQTAWRWNDLRQLVLDNDAGLRGYQLNKFAGANRIVSNLELRAFPEWSAWIAKLSLVGFWDMGTVWDNDIKFVQSRYHHSLGLGIRIHNTKATGNTSIFRFDFAFNMDDKKFGGIVFTTDQLFTVFNNHEFKLPKILGLEFDGD